MYSALQRTRRTAVLQQSLKILPAVRNPDMQVFYPLRCEVVASRTASRIVAIRHRGEVERCF